MTELERIGAIRTAATWLRKTSQSIDKYPKRDRLDSTMRTQAQQFANGRLPWPHRWTVRLYELAVQG
jgi:hypothetical protein